MRAVRRFSVRSSYGDQQKDKDASRCALAKNCYTQSRSCFAHSRKKAVRHFFATPCSLNDVNCLKTAKAPAHIVWTKYDALKKIWRCSLWWDQRGWLHETIARQTTPTPVCLFLIRLLFYFSCAFSKIQKLFACLYCSFENLFVCCFTENITIQILTE